jgi:hypothetical protein
MARTPVSVVTVEREYGSRGGEFAHDLAAQLGWRLLDSDLPCAAARAAGVTPELAAKYDEKLDPWYYRYGRVFWHDAVTSLPGLSEEQVFDSERMALLMRKEIESAAKQGNCVIVGRGAACALAGHPGCFHVFVYATASAKRDWFMRTFPDQAHNADQMLAAADKRRAAFIRGHYQQEWCARGLYHMLLNSCIGVDAMIAAVRCAGVLKESCVATSA